MTAATSSDRGRAGHRRPVPEHRPGPRPHPGPHRPSAARPGGGPSGVGRRRAGERVRDARPVLRRVRDHRGLLLREIMGSPRHASGHRQGVAPPRREARRDGREARGWTARLRARTRRARASSSRRRSTGWSTPFGMWILAWGCGVVHADGSPIVFGEACALMGMLGCAILIPGPPGMLGVFQAGIYAGMTMYFPTDIVTGPGAAYVFLMYATQVVLTLALGGLGLYMRARRRRAQGARGVRTRSRPSSFRARGKLGPRPATPLTPEHVLGCEPCCPGRSADGAGGDGRDRGDRGAGRRQVHVRVALRVRPHVERRGAPGPGRQQLEGHREGRRRRLPAVRLRVAREQQQEEDVAGDARVRARPGQRRARERAGAAARRCRSTRSRCCSIELSTKMRHEYGDPPAHKKKQPVDPPDAGDAGTD